MELAFRHQGLHLPRQDRSVHRAHRTVEEAAALAMISSTDLERMHTAVWSSQPIVVAKSEPVVSTISSEVCAGADTPAFKDDPLEQARGAWRNVVEQGGYANGAFAEYRHIVRVTAERLDVLFHPFQRSLLVERAVIAERMALSSAGCAI
ncbi:hypothetical protein V1280_008643 [Bradyrhizobium sp. AZCC 2230]